MKSVHVVHRKSPTPELHKKREKSKRGRGEEGGKKESRTWGFKFKFKAIRMEKRPLREIPVIQRASFLRRG